MATAIVMLLLRFMYVSQWKEEIDSKVLLPNKQPIPVVLLGNKCDLDEAEIDRAKLDDFWYPASLEHGQFE